MKSLTSSEFRNNPLFLRNQFHGTEVFELPIIRRQNIDINDIKLIGYDKTKLDDKANEQSFVHFFLDDYKFEVLWNDPEPRLKKLSQYKAVLSPQFSTYYTMPTSMQIYNTFRSRWCGAYLQSKGLTVIPTVSWGQPQSYWYCFDAIEKGAVVAVSTLGVKSEQDFFLMGYQEMLRRIEPKAILCYCEPFPEMRGNIIAVNYADTNHLEVHRKFWMSSIANATIQKDAYCFPEYSQNANGDYLVKTFGYVISAGMGGGGGRYRMGRSHGNTPRDNKRQNDQFKAVCDKLKLTPKKRNELHHIISHEGMGYQELLAFARDWFGIIDE